MRNVLVLAGAGGTAFDSNQVNMLVENLKNISGTSVSLVGDGEQDISIEQIRTELSRLSNSENEVTIFMQMHGEVKNGEFYFMTSDDKPTSSKELFEAISDEFGNKKVDIFATSCHSGACLQDKGLLPKGSAVATLSQGHETTAGSEVKKLINNLDSISGDVTAFNLLQLYCSKVLVNRIPPEFGISGEEETIQLDALLKDSLRQQVNTQNVKSSLTPYIESEELGQLMERMGSAKSEYEFGAVDYGKALAVCMASNFGNDITSENYRPFTSSGKNPFGHSTLGFSDGMDFFRMTDSRVPAINRNSAKRNLMQAFREMQEPDINREEL